MITFTNMAFGKIPQCRWKRNFLSNFHQLLLPSQLAGNLLFKSQVEAQPGEDHHLCSAVTLLLPKDKLDIYSKYTRFQNMRPPALEAMVSRRGNKAEACGA